uniref:Uncharacterized protein n=1 Tax=Triticum aestivum TaxID=4565 RepID=A0A080YUD7_WHEAT|nr:unnamed protein product [Triticum aestivum]
MEAYQKVQEFDLSSGADWKTTANVLFTVPPSTRSSGTGLGGQWGQEGPRSEVPACQLAVSLHDTINLLARLSMIYPFHQLLKGVRMAKEVQGADGISAGGEGADQEGDAIAGRRGRSPGSRRCFRAARG